MCTVLCIYKVINLTRHRSIKHCILCHTELKYIRLSPKHSWCVVRCSDCVLRDVCKFPRWCCRWRFHLKLRLIFVCYFCHSQCLGTAHRLGKKFHNLQSWWRQSLLSDPVSGNKTSVTFWRRNFFFLILAHAVYKMWIIQEPNTVELWNRLHFEEKKTESIYHV